MAGKKFTLSTHSQKRPARRLGYWSEARTLDPIARSRLAELQHMPARLRGQARKIEFEEPKKITSQ